MNIQQPLQQLIVKLSGWVHAVIINLSNLVAAVLVVLLFWIDFVKQTDYLAARSQAVTAIKRAFDANDITIPFPIRTLDFAAVGGSTLAEAVTDAGLGGHAKRQSPRDQMSP